MREYDFTQAKAMIKKYEGLRLEAYKCPAGVWTIGYGHTAGVQAGDKLTREAAEALFEADVARFYGAPSFRTFCEVYDLNNNEANAMLSFVYNGGLGWLSQVSDNYKRDKKTIGEKMLLYCNAGGKRLEGLVKRRNEEHTLFCTPEENKPVNEPARRLVARVVVTTYDKNGQVITEVEI